VLDKVNLCNRALGQLGDAEGAEAEALRDKLTTLLRKYERFATVFAEIIPVAEGPVDLEDLIDHIPSAMMGVFSSMARRALGLGARVLPGASGNSKKSAARKSCGGARGAAPSAALRATPR
jgi:hypothetical protein